MTTAIVIVVRRPEQPPELPLSQPPPHGGSLQAPPTLGGAPLAPGTTDPTWVARTLPEYDAQDVLWEYYDARTLDRGLISVVALRGPVDDLPDRNAVGHFDDWTLQDQVQCSPLWLGPPKSYEGDLDLPDEPVKTDGHVCWRSSGDFSVSVLTTRHDLDETTSLVNEFWAAQ